MGGRVDFNPPTRMTRWRIPRGTRKGRDRTYPLRRGRATVTTLVVAAAFFLLDLVELRATQVSCGNNGV